MQLEKLSISDLTTLIAHYSKLASKITPLKEGIGLEQWKDYMWRKTLCIEAREAKIKEIEFPARKTN